MIGSFPVNSGAYILTEISAYIDTYFYNETSDSWILKDHWQYNPVADLWTRNPDLPCSNIENMATFSIGTKIYLASVSGDNGLTDDFWEFETTMGILTQLADVPGGREWQETEQM